MIYEKAQLIAPLKTGKDSLGNEIIKDQVIGTYDVRLTEWNIEEQKLLGSKFTNSNRKCLVKFNKKLEKTNKIVIDTNVYKVNKVINLSKRWYLFYIETWRLNG